MKNGLVQLKMMDESNRHICSWVNLHMSLVTRKPVWGVCDQLRLKLACPASEVSKSLEFLDIASRDIILSKQRTTKVLIRLRICGLICTCVVCIWQEQVLSCCGSYFLRQACCPLAVPGYRCWSDSAVRHHSDLWEEEEQTDARWRWLPGR